MTADSNNKALVVKAYGRWTASTFITPGDFFRFSNFGSWREAFDWAYAVQVQIHGAARSEH